jgi:ketol-acid reductoisomerase
VDVAISVFTTELDSSLKEAEMLDWWNGFNVKFNGANDGAANE